MAGKYTDLAGFLLSLSMVVLNSRDRNENYGFRNFALLINIKTTLQQALAEKTNLDALVLL